jgi:colanic acid/amylovoran biosynthesis glycosyltransferase
MGRADAPRPVGYVLRKFPVLSETFILSEMLALEARGVPLHVFSLMRPNDPRFHEDLPRLKARVTYVPGIEDAAKLLRHQARLARRDGTRYARALLYALGRGHPTLLWRFLQAGYVANEARRLRLTHLHAQFATRPTTVALLASRLTGIPFSFTTHAMDIFTQRVDRGALARKIREARFVVAVSEFNKAYVEQVAGTRGGTVVRVYNGIDLERFAPDGVPPARPFRLLCVARLVEKKGLPVLIEACRLLAGRGVEFRCDIVGKGLLRPALEATIRRHRLGSRVRLLGPLTQQEVRARYHGSHLYVLPCVEGRDGNRDGLPVSIVEALACGLPVVTTPMTGIPEVVRHGENGLLVPVGDAAALADAVATLIGDPALFARFAAAARPSVEETFDRRRTIAQLHGLMQGAAP